MSQGFSGEIITDPQLETAIINLQHKAEDPADSLSAKVAPHFGSNLFSYQVGGHELIHYDPELLKDRDWTGTFVLWPKPSRIKGKQYEFEDQVYSVQKVKRKHGNETLIHGFVDDQPWEHGEPFVDENGAGVKTWIDITPDSPMFEFYPFQSRLTLTYLLHQAGIRVEYAAENLGDTNMPFGFALHPFFTMPSGPDQALVTLPADHIMEADKELLPTGKLLPMGSQGYDLRRPTPVSETLLDDVYTGLHKDAHPTIDYPELNVRLKLASSPDLTHVVVFTAQQKLGFFCVENQSSSPDAANLHAQALRDNNEALARAAHLLIAGPGETHRGFIDYQVERLKSLDETSR